jgi:hypothetical protein
MGYRGRSDLFKELAPQCLDLYRVPSPQPVLAWISELCVAVCFHRYMIPRGSYFISHHSRADQPYEAVWNATGCRNDSQSHDLIDLMQHIWLVDIPASLHVTESHRGTLW